MSRPQSPHSATVREKILAGKSTKMVAYEIKMTAAAVSKMLSNMADIRKQYVTDIEYAQLLKSRKTT